MAGGELTGLYQDTALTNVAAKRKRLGGLISRIFPSIPVSKLTGKIYVKSPNHANLIIQDTTRAPGAAARLLFGENPTTIPFTISDHSLADILPDELRIADTAIQDDMDSVGAIVEQLELVREKQGYDYIDTALTAASRVANLSGTDQFTHASSHPITYITGKMTEIATQMGVRPNFIAMDYPVAAVLMEHADVQARIRSVLSPDKNNMGLDSIAQVLGAIFGVNQVIIGDGNVYNSAKKGQSASLTSIWGDSVLIGYTEAPSVQFAGLGLNLTYSGVWAGNPAQIVPLTSIGGYSVEIGRLALRGSTLYVVHNYRADLIVNAYSGYLLKDTLA